MFTASVSTGVLTQQRIRTPRQQDLLWFSCNLRRIPGDAVEMSRRNIAQHEIASEQRQEKYRHGAKAPLMFILKLFGPLRPLGELGRDDIARIASGTGFENPWQP